MTAESKKRLQSHRFFEGLAPAAVKKLAACGGIETAPAHVTIATEGASADRFYALLSGRMAIETYVPGKPPITLQTVEAGDVVGWSWVDGREWVFDVRTLSECELFSFDASRVMDVLNEDKTLGFEIMRRLNRVVSDRLGATRLQLLDIYGQGESSG